jgi:hypothetical protein
MNNRNKKCWCGSDKKYKKCHLEADVCYDEAIRINEYINRQIELNKKRIRKSVSGAVLAQSIYFNYTCRGKI